MSRRKGDEEKREREGCLSLFFVYTTRRAEIMMMAR